MDGHHAHAIPIILECAAIALTTYAFWRLYKSYRLSETEERPLKLSPKSKEKGKNTSTSCGSDHNSNSCKPSSNCGCQATATNPFSSSLFEKNELSNLHATIFYASETGTSEGLAQKLHAELLSYRIFSAEVVDPSNYEPEDLPKEKLVIFVVSTWVDGKAPGHARFLADWLEESSTDFRVGSGLLRGVKFAVFGIGSSAYGTDNFCAASKSMHRQLLSLGAESALPLTLADVDASEPEASVDSVFDKWALSLLSRLSLSSNAAAPELTQAAEYSESESEAEEEADGGVVDLEDVAGRQEMETADKDGAGSSAAEQQRQGVKKKWFVRKGKSKDSQKSTAAASRKLLSLNGKANSSSTGPREMVTPVIRASLEKQGYKILGSHSGVKMCRWTKSQLRGRGGCYKHSFYGIESHRCMEATPSLACANKCVFCWRHHSNPVGRSWTWKVDPPQAIVEGALQQHCSMVKQMKGVPGVTAERLAEGLDPRHCALSLVGEPIMYPHISELVRLLHQRRMSTFLVTNAQFPQLIRDLAPVTQLYVSVDASTKESLKAIDRPLFADYWDRFTSSLTALKEKRQRTVYRLTLVKGWNMDEVKAYNELLSLGQPDFIEIKGVTYCGTSSGASSLTMENVPWHSEVCEFAQALGRLQGGAYQLACEHQHSCCVLLARTDKFKKDGQWHTWIDYDKFHDLVASGEPFSSEDYMAPTPAWAVFGAPEGGFDPSESRVRKERRHGAASTAGSL